MAYPMGELKQRCLRVDFDRRLKSQTRHEEVNLVRLTVMLIYMVNIR